MNSPDSVWRISGYCSKKMRQSLRLVGPSPLTPSALRRCQFGDDFLAIFCAVLALLFEFDQTGSDEPVADRQAGIDRRGGTLCQRGVEIPRSMRVGRDANESRPPFSIVNESRVAEASRLCASQWKSEARGPRSMDDDFWLPLEELVKNQDLTSFCRFL